MLLNTLEAKVIRVESESLDREAMIKRITYLCVLGFALVGFATSGWAQSYDDGMRAYNNGEYEKALEIWEPIAEAGDGVAQYSLGKLLESGGGRVQKNYASAVGWYRLSAAQGITAAQNNLGLMYAQGRGVPRDVTRAAELWLAASQQDHPIAQFNLGLAYYRGEGVEKAPGKTEYWFRRAATLGLPDAQYALGQLKRLGITSEANESEALDWYEKAASQGHEQARAQAAQLRSAGVKRIAATAAPPPQVAPSEAAPKLTKPKLAKPKLAKPKLAEAEQSNANAAIKKPAMPPPPAEKPKAPVVQAPAKQAPAMQQTAKAPAAPSAALGTGDAGGAYNAWLISTKSEAEAASFLQQVLAQHPAVFADAKGAVEPVDAGTSGTLYRVVAGGLASRDAALAFCARLRSKDPGAFCKLLSN